MNKGLLYAVVAYLLWGFLPVYWKALQAVPAAQIVGHRMVWSLVFVGVLFVLKNRWPQFLRSLKHIKVVAIYLAAATILTGNWFIYIWGVNTGYVLETALGYFINPLVNVLLGVVLLHEQLRLWQWVAVGVAALGVLYLTIVYGALPWLALALAFSFAIYGLVKKIAPLDALNGLFLETALLCLPALLFLLYQDWRGAGAFGHAGLTTTVLLVGTGLVTALPLLLFAAAVRQIPLSTIGLLQYLAPTIQFFLGVLVYGEPFTLTRLIGFVFIWLALVIYSVDGARQRRKAAPAYAAN
jgi:chloramphenicol-sensitive protein RarD